MNEPQAFAEIAENIAFLEDWEDRYRYLIELGQAMPPLKPEEKTPETKVQGCVSQAWLVTDRDGPLLRYRGESDALIVKGLVAVLVALYSGRTAPEIAETDAIAIFDELGLREHLTTQRSNGLAAMVKRIRAEASVLATV